MADLLQKIAEGLPVQLPGQKPKFINLERAVKNEFLFLGQLRINFFLAETPFTFDWKNVFKQLDGWGVVPVFGQGLTAPSEYSYCFTFTNRRSIEKNVKQLEQFLVELQEHEASKV